MTIVFSPKTLILVVLFGSGALAEDFSIIGKQYKNAELIRVEPDGITLKTKSGISKIYYTELPKEVQKQFPFTAQQAAEYTAQTTAQTLEQNRLAREQQVEQDKKRAEEIAKNVEMQRQQQEREIQRQQEEAQQQQLQPQTAIKPTYSRSQEGIPEHTYEITQDHTIVAGGLRIRLRRGEQYQGRILVDHAEIDINGVSYPVPSGILRKQQDAPQQQVQPQTAIKPTYSRSQEGIPEHTYEITQDHTIVVAGGLRIRLRRGEQYQGRILVDHAEIDINGVSYPVPSGILRQMD